MSGPSASDMARIVSERTRLLPDAEASTMTSGFPVLRHLASSMHSGRVLLAGDAGHVVSPIGGQGMNVGWLDGREASLTSMRSVPTQNGAGLLRPAVHDARAGVG